jgi:glutamate carboxypeptidase
MTAIERIVANSTVTGTIATLTIAGKFLPLVETPMAKKMYDNYAACASELGLPIKGEFTGGCADSGFAAEVGAPTICAVGPVGGKAHTPEEYLEIDTMVPRARTLALAIMRLQ